MLPAIQKCSHASHPEPGARYRQGGAIAVMMPGLVFAIMAMCGFAIGLSQVYNRKIELQQLSDAVAVVAAHELDGTQAGVDRAVAAAATTAMRFLYSYNNNSFDWSGEAIQFATGPDGGTGGWVGGGTARNSPQQIYYVKVDTSRLDPSSGVVENPFLSIISAASASVGIASHSIAGRLTMNVTPIAVCAMSTTPAQSRSGELVEYGFRRGVSYDLMRLNPNGTKAENFLLNPIAPPGAAAWSVASDLDVVAPYVCTGTLALPGLGGGRVTVERPFPLKSLSEALNSRFGIVPSCNPVSAPPDTNVKAYVYNTGATWMTTAPSGQTAQSLTSSGKLWTVADPSPSPTGTAGAAFGPLWAYARAVQYAATEPSSGYTPYPTSAWSTLYSPGSPTAKSSYPSTTPYQLKAGANFQAPPAGYKGLEERRVLNVPLLECPVPTGPMASANVLAVGKFFMTVPATDTSLSVEFGGVAHDQALVGEVRLFE